MWAQLIKVRVQPGFDMTAMAEVLERFEQPGSGLLRELFMQDTKDADSAYVLALFESEEKARDREHDPRRAEGQRRSALGRRSHAAPGFGRLGADRPQRHSLRPEVADASGDERAGSEDNQPAHER